MDKTWEMREMKYYTHQREWLTSTAKRKKQELDVEHITSTNFNKHSQINAMCYIYIYVNKDTEYGSKVRILDT